MRKETLDESKYYSTLSQYVLDAVIATDNETKIQSWNKGAQKLYGWKQEEVLGKKAAKVIPTEFVTDNREKFWEKFSRYGTWTGEVIQKTKDGTKVSVLASITAVKDVSGKIIGALAVNRDITDRKLLEGNLAYLAEASKILSSSLDYKTTLSNITMLAVPKIADWCSVDLLDENGQLQQVALAHKDPKKVKWAKELRKLDPPDMNAPNGLPNVIRTGKSELYPDIPDELLVKVAKSKKHLKLARSLGLKSAMVVPIHTGGKCIGGISFVTQDTKRHYNETDLAMAEELASRASLSIENASLYKDSQEAIAMRDNFISVASHELKTPLTSVKIFTQVLQQHSEQIGDIRAREQLGRMDKQLNKLIDLIYNLLNISKIQAGRMEYNQVLFDFDKLVKEVSDTFQQGSKKHKLLVRGRTGKKVYGDEDRLGQVLSNLISNAIKYSPNADRVVLTLRSDKNKIVVCVEDFGIGVAEEHLERIFERFYRVFDTTDKTFPGLGIGLYISAEIVSRHYGKIWVESKVGKGSKFFFSLPLKRNKELNGVKMI